MTDDATRQDAASPDAAASRPGPPVAIVTGASSGIGEAVARSLDERGFGVVVNSRASVEEGEAVAASLRDAVYVQGDVADPATGPALVGAALERWGRLDGLVNNAGRTIDVPIHDVQGVRLDHWEAIFRTNVFGTFLVAQAALPALAESDDGWIVNVGSIAGVRQTGSALPYSVSKAAVHHMTALLAKFSPGVRVNAVAPGLIETPWTAEWDAQKAFVTGVVPMRRTGTPEDVAAAVCVLIDSPYTTGVVLLADGGMSVVV